eukprot:SAG31_NODE_25017_length_469_cov_5.294595_1_plen_77_part_00
MTSVDTARGHRYGGAHSQTAVRARAVFSHGLKQAEDDATAGDVWRCRQPAIAAVRPLSAPSEQAGASSTPATNKTH